MSCINVLQGTPTWLPFVATDVNTGTPRTGIIFSQIDVSYKKSNQIALSIKALAAGDFQENGNGVYEIKFSGTELDTTGSFIYAVTSNPSLPAPALKQFVGLASIQSSATYTPGTISVSTNIITGNLINSSGKPLVGEAVSARVLSAPTVTGVSPNIGGVGTDIVSAQTDSSGFFFIELVQGIVVDIVIPSVNYRRTLTVPSNATDVLFDIP